MNEKIKNYVSLIFDGVPRSQKANELRNEITSNLNDRYEALIAEGKTENEAYGFAIAELGNIDDLINELMPDAEIMEKVNKERKRKAIIVAIAFTLYILSFAQCLLQILFQVNPIIIAVSFIVIIAIATGMLVYINISTPQELLPYMNEAGRVRKNLNDSFESSLDQRSPFQSSLRSFLWLMIVVVYFLVSFITGAWHITWLIFIAGSAISKGINAIFYYFNSK